MSVNHAPVTIVGQLKLRQQCWLCGLVDCAPHSSVLPLALRVIHLGGGCHALDLFLLLASKLGNACLPTIALRRLLASKHQRISKIKDTTKKHKPSLSCSLLLVVTVEGGDFAGELAEIRSRLFFVFTLSTGGRGEAKSKRDGPFAKTSSWARLKRSK